MCPRQVKTMHYQKMGWIEKEKCYCTTLLSFCEIKVNRNQYHVPFL